VAHEAAVAHDQHGSGHGHGHGKDHVPHVTPLATYFKTFGALMVLTVITVAVSRIDLGTTTNLIIAMVIAATKATIVAALFMHLYADHRFHTIIFASSIVFLFVFVIFTSFDLMERGRAESVEGDRPFDSAKPWEASPKVPMGTAMPAAIPAAPKH